jgi:hypothetical protein
MTDQQYPITPPPELVHQWLRERELLDSPPLVHHYLATRAAQWGWDQRGTNNEAQLQERADQELEACVTLVNDWAQRLGYQHYGVELRATRRPNLKQEALALLPKIKGEDVLHLSPLEVDKIRRALKALPE